MQGFWNLPRDRNSPLNRIASLVAGRDRYRVLPFLKLEKMVEEKWPEALNIERKKIKKTLPKLPNVERFGRKIITRFSPNPDCVLHLGSARAIILSYEYARINNGMFYLRFEDTDPKVKKPQIFFYQAIREAMGAEKFGK